MDIVRCTRANIHMFLGNFREVEFKNHFHREFISKRVSISSYTGYEQMQNEL